MRNLYTLLFLFILTPVAIFGQNRQDSNRTKDVQWDVLLRQREVQHIRDSVTVMLLKEELRAKEKGKNNTAAMQQLAILQAQDSLMAAREADTIRIMSQQNASYAVTLFQDTVFSIYTSLGPYDAKHRAEDVMAKIKRLYELPDFAPDSIQLQLHKDISTISYGKMIITGISQTDALIENMTVDSLANSYATAIKKSILHYRESNSWANTLKRIGWSLLYVLIASVLIYLINRIFIFFVYKIFRNRGKYVKEMRVKSYRILDRARIFSFIVFLFKSLRLLIIFIVCFIAFQSVLRLFPLTYDWSDRLLHLVQIPLTKLWYHAVNYFPNFVVLMVIYFATHLLLKALKYFAIEIENGSLSLRNFYKEWGLPTYKILRFMLWMLALVIAFPYLPGSGSAAFKGVSVFLGVLITIGSSSSLSNVFSGIIITYMRPFQVNDWINVGDITGYVVEKSLLVTRLRTLQNEDITIPNSQILAAHTVNYSATSEGVHAKGLAIKVSISVNYQTDWRKVFELLEFAAANTKDVVKYPEPFVLQQNLNNFNISYELNAYTLHPERMFFIHSELLNRIMEAFHNAGIDMISPQYIHINKDA